MSTRITTGKVRLSYPHIFTAVQIQGEGDPKFSASLLIPKTSGNTLKEMRAAISEAIALGVEKGLWPKTTAESKLKLPLRDGDDDKPDDPAYKGMFFINTTSQSKPGVFDLDKEKVLDESMVYAGCYVRANVNFYPFKAKGNIGVAVGLNSIQFLADGTPFGGGKSDPNIDFKDDDFEDAFEDDDDPFA